MRSWSNLPRYTLGGSEVHHFPSEKHQQKMMEIYGDIYIWENYSNSLTWIKAIKGDDSPNPNHHLWWGRSEVVIIYPDKLQSDYLKKCHLRHQATSGGSPVEVSLSCWSMIVGEPLPATTYISINIAMENHRKMVILWWFYGDLLGFDGWYPLVMTDSAIEKGHL